MSNVHKENQTTLDWWPTHFNPTGCDSFAISDPTRTVDEVMSTPSDYVGEEFAIRGEVRDSSIDNESMTFLLHGSDYEILVDFVDASVSNGLDDNRTVYAKGKLRIIDSGYVFEAEIIKTSCPSKYEE